jgi:hypothetical protein
MAHVIFAFYGHQGAHEKLVSEINNWRYDVISNRVGQTAPLISEIKFYDVRIPEGVVPDFLRDMKMNFVGEPVVSKQPQRIPKKIVSALLTIMRKLCGFKNVKPAPGPQRYALKTSWFQAFLIGVMKDDEQIDTLSGIKKEVL